MSSWVSLQLEQKDDRLRFVSTTWALPTDWQLLAVLWLRLHLNVHLMWSSHDHFCLYLRHTDKHSNGFKRKFWENKVKCFSPHYYNLNHTTGMDIGQDWIETWDKLHINLNPNPGSDPTIFQVLRSFRNSLAFFLEKFARSMSVETVDWIEQTGAPGSDRGHDLFSCGPISPPFAHSSWKILIWNGTISPPFLSLRMWDV